MLRASRLPLMFDGRQVGGRRGKMGYIMSWSKMRDLERKYCLEY